MEFGFKHCFFSSVFWENLGFLFDTKFTLTYRGWGRWCVYLFSSGPIRYSSNYLTMLFFFFFGRGTKNVSNGVLFISSEYSVSSTSLHFSITVNLLCVYKYLFDSLAISFFIFSRKALVIDEKRVKECGITILFSYQVYHFWRTQHFQVIPVHILKFH